MLAALEGPSGSSYVAAEPSYGDSFDEFLDDFESTRESSVAPKRQTFSVDPPAHAAARVDHSSYNDLVHSALNDEPEFDPAQAHAEHADANWFDPSSSPEYHSPEAAAQALQGQGYERHSNRGKWINYQGGTASDFRIKGTTSSKVGYVHAITLRSLDDYGEPAKITGPRDFIGVVMTHMQSGEDVPAWYRDNGDATYDLAFHATRPGTVRLEIKLCGNPMFDINIQVEAAGRSAWIAKPRLPVEPRQRFVIDIVTEDGSRPDGVAPFEVQTMGDVEELKVMNNGDGTYQFVCIPQRVGHLTVMITLHGQPIKNSPVTVAVGNAQQGHFVKQVSRGVESKDVEGIHYQPDNASPVYASEYNMQPMNAQPMNSRPSQAYTPSARPSQAYTPSARPSQAYPAVSHAQPMNAGSSYSSAYDASESYQPRPSGQVSTDDLNALLDELGA